MEVERPHAPAFLGRGWHLWTNTRHKVAGVIGMPFNRTAVPGLYCVGEYVSGSGLNAVAFSGLLAHRWCGLGL